MLLHDIPESPQLKMLNELFGTAVHRQLSDLSATDPLVMFLDGEGVTKDHTNYHLLDLTYQQAMENAAKSVCKGMDAEYLALLDEISIVFLEPVQLLTRHHYWYHDEVVGFFVQEFQKAFAYQVPVKFHIKAYNIPKDSVPKFFDWRRMRSEQALYQYIAKEDLYQCEYVGKSVEELKKTLHKHHLLTDSPRERMFLNGLSGDMKREEEKEEERLTEKEEELVAGYIR